MTNYDEIPVTKDGLKIYIAELEKIIKPRRQELKKLEDKLMEANNRIKLR